MSNSYADILDVIQDPAMILTTAGTITNWNDAALEAFRCAQEDFAGRDFATLFPEERARDWEMLRRRLLAGEPIKGHRAVQRAATGEILETSLSGSAIGGGERGDWVVAVLVTMRDLTAANQNERALDALRVESGERGVVLEAVSGVALEILSSLTGVEALRRIADAARTLTRARYSALGVCREDGPGLAEFVVSGLTPEQEAAIGPQPRGAGILGLLMERATPLRIDNLGADPASVGFPPHHPPMDSFLGVPIRKGDVVLGSLYLTCKEGGPFTEADEVSVAALGAHAAVAIHNLRMLARQRALVRKMIHAQEEERRAVASEIHDGIAQYVMASHVTLEAFRKASQAGSVEKAERHLDQAVRHLNAAALEARRLVNSLGSLALEDLGLAGAVEQLCEQEKSLAGWAAVDFQQNIDGLRFDESVEIAAYRVVQEALANVRRHAASERVDVRLRLTSAAGAPPRLQIDVRDWGVGFDPSAPSSRGAAHHGLAGMAERIGLVGGTFSLRSRPGEGTLIRAAISAAPAPPNGEILSSTALV